MELRISGVVEESIVDGPGLRFVIFTQGCPHRCEGCHNPHTHDFAGGEVIDIDELAARFRKNGIVQGLTLSGGEPFAQPEALAALCRDLKRDDVPIMAYTGYTFEELMDMAAENTAVNELLSLCDILVDGRFDLSQRSLLLKFRGSHNQRILDVPASLAQGEAVAIER